MILLLQGKDGSTVRSMRWYQVGLTVLKGQVAVATWPFYVYKKRIPHRPKFGIRQLTNQHSNTLRYLYT